MSDVSSGLFCHRTLRCWCVGCLLQMGVLIPTSLVLHNFWDFAASTPAHQIEFMNFIKVWQTHVAC